MEKSKNKEKNENKSKFCSICGVVHPTEDLTEFGGKRLCPECLSRETIVCSHCGERIWSEYNQGTLSMPLCNDCYDEFYTACAECGRIIHNEDGFSTDDIEEMIYCGTY